MRFDTYDSGRYHLTMPVKKAERGHERLRRVILDKFGVDVRTAKPRKRSEVLAEIRATARAAREANAVERQEKPPAEDRLLRLAEVLRLTGLSRATIYRLERAGRFPKRRQISDNAVGWYETEVRAWSASRPRSK